MNVNPEFIEVDGKKYKINSDYKIALKCNQIACDNSISDYERPLAIIFLLFGKEALYDKKNRDQLLNLAIKYLKCGKDNNFSNEKADMDILQDYKLIEASFKSDYGITLSQENMHWWDFYNYLNGLTDKCVLNRVRDIRTYDLSTVKDIKERNRIRKLQNYFALKENKIPLTEQQKESMNRFYELTGIKRKE